MEERISHYAKQKEPINQTILEQQQSILMKFHTVNIKINEAEEAKKNYELSIANLKVNKQINKLI